MAWGDLPGGKVESTQDVSDAIYRETLEETAIALPFAKLFDFELLYKPHEKLPIINLKYISLISNQKVVLSDEHDLYKWVAQEEASRF